MLPVSDAVVSAGNDCCGLLVFCFPTVLSGPSPKKSRITTQDSTFTMMSSELKSTDTERSSYTEENRRKAEVVIIVFKGNKTQVIKRRPKKLNTSAFT